MFQLVHYIKLVDIFSFLSKRILKDNELCGSQSSQSITWETVINAHFQAQLKHSETNTLDAGPRNFYFIKKLYGDSCTDLCSMFL